MIADRWALGIVGLMHAELRRQRLYGALKVVDGPDENGRIEIIGMLDLAALANVAEEALRQRAERCDAHSS